MKIVIFICSLFLIGCSTLGGNKSTTPPDYVSHTYPTPQNNPSRCVTGKIDLMINGPLATTIWYVDPQNQMVNLRLAHGKSLTIRFAGDTFCFDYFEVATNK